MVSLLYAIAALLCVVALPYLLTFSVMLRTMFHCMKIEPANPDQMPEHLRDLFQGAIADLEPHGFRLTGYHLIEQRTTKDGQEWGVMLQHESQPVFAGLMIYQPLNNATPFLLTLCTFFADDSLLITLNVKHYGIYSRSPVEIAQYLEGATPAEQWQAHRDRLEQLRQTKTPRNLSPDAFITALQAHSKTGIERLVQRREVSWVQPGETYRMTWWTAARAVFQVVRKRKQAPRNAPSFQEMAIENSVATQATTQLEIDEFYRLQRNQADPFSRRARSWLLLGTLALFIAVYSSVFDPQKLLIFVAVLLFHEGGHVLAMKLFGYRDTMMLFIPFLGALATARKENASLSEKVWISLAGPLPGLFLGIGLAIASSLFNSDSSHISNWFAESNWIREASWMLIILNLFNLLPVYPLDGGQVADLLLFSRNPYLGVVFKGIGVLLLGLIGIAQPLFLVFTILIAITIPGSFRFARINTRLRKELRNFAPDDRESIVQFLFTKLQTPPYQSLPFAKKYGLVVGLLDNRREETARWTTRAGLIGIYLISLLAGLGGGLYAFIPNWQTWTTAVSYLFQDPKAALKQKMQQQLEKANQQLQANPKDIDAYLNRGRARVVLDDYTGAIADANQILRLNPNSVEGYRLRSEAHRGAGEKASSMADRQKWLALDRTQRLQKLNQALSKNPKDVQSYLARAMVRTEMKNFIGAIADCNQVLRLNPQNTDALWQRGGIYLQLKNYKQALADANQMLAIKPNSPDGYSLRSEVRRQVGDETGAIADEQKAETLYQTL